MIDLSALADESTYVDGDDTYLRMARAVGAAIDPDIESRREDRPMDDEDSLWLDRKVDAVLDALNNLGFLKAGDPR